MALGFNSAPVNWDFSNILLSNQAGAHLGAGLSQMGRGFAAGIEGWAQRKRMEDNLRRAEEEAKRQREAIDQRAKGLLGLAKTAPELFGGPDRANAIVDEVSREDMPAEARYGRLQGELDAAAARRELERWTLQQQQATQRAQMEAQSQAALRSAMAPRPTQGPLRPDVLAANEAWNAAPVSERYMQAVAAGAPIDPGILEITSKLDSNRAERMKPPAPAPGAAIPVDASSPFVWSGHQLIPNPAWNEPSDPASGTGPRVSADGQFYEESRGKWKAMREDNPPRLSAQDSANLNAAYNSLQAATERIAELEREVEQDGNFKFLGPNRNELIEVERQKLRRAQATIDRLESRTRSSTAPTKAVDWEKVW